MKRMIALLLAVLLLSLPVISYTEQTVYQKEENTGRDKDSYPYIIRMPFATWYLAKADIELLGADAYYEGLYAVLDEAEADLADAREALKGYIPDEIAVFSNEELLERVFSLSDLSSSGARTVSAEYERLFGERYFYEVLQQTVHSSNNLYASDLLPDIQYIPQCITLKDMYQKVFEALLWCNLPQNDWMMHGKILTTKEYYQAIMDTRKYVLNACSNIAAKHKNNRQYFLAKTAYFFFAPGGPDVPAQMQAFGEEWRKFRLEQQNYIYSYNPMDEAKAAQIKEYAIKNGIPGDPLFNWVRSLD